MALTSRVTRGASRSQGPCLRRGMRARLPEEIASRRITEPAVRRREGEGVRALVSASDDAALHYYSKEATELMQLHIRALH
jgi:hypothetical protein